MGKHRCSTKRKTCSNCSASLLPVADRVFWYFNKEEEHYRIKSQCKSCHDKGRKGMNGPKKSWTHAEVAKMHPIWQRDYTCMNAGTRCAKKECDVLLDSSTGLAAYVHGKKKFRWKTYCHDCHNLREWTLNLTDRARFLSSHASNMMTATKERKQPPLKHTVAVGLLDAMPEPEACYFCGTDVNRHRAAAHKAMTPSGDRTRNDLPYDHPQQVLVWGCADCQMLFSYTIAMRDRHRFVQRMLDPMSLPVQPVSEEVLYNWARIAANSGRTRWRADIASGKLPPATEEQIAAFSTEFVLEIYRREGGRCAATRLPAVVDNHGPDKTYSASMDKDPEDGYLPRHVRLMLYTVNFSKNNGSTMDEVNAHLKRLTDRERAGLIQWDVGNNPPAEPVEVPATL